MRRARGFTLLELAVVVTIVGVMAAVAAPALTALDEARRASAADRLIVALDAARSHAMSTGVPAGVRVDASAGTFAALVHDAGAGGAAPLPGPLGEASEVVDVQTRFPGVRIESALFGDGSSVVGAVWFDHDARPHARAGDGARMADSAADAVFTLTGGHAARVVARTGAVLRETGVGP